MGAEKLLSGVVTPPLLPTPWPSPKPAVLSGSLSLLSGQSHTLINALQAARAFRGNKIPRMGFPV